MYFLANIQDMCSGQKNYARLAKGSQRCATGKPKIGIESTTKQATPVDIPWTRTSNIVNSFFSFKMWPRHGMWKNGIQ